jgi:hypothetical protein
MEGVEVPTRALTTLVMQIAATGTSSGAATNGEVPNTMTRDKWIKVLPPVDIKRPGKPTDIA